MHCNYHLTSTSATAEKSSNAFVAYTRCEISTLETRPFTTRTGQGHENNGDLGVYEKQASNHLDKQAGKPAGKQAQPWRDTSDIDASITHTTHTRARILGSASSQQASNLQAGGKVFVSVSSVRGA